ncbi:MAG: hypothetical protein WB763_04815, partial [Terriglobia bacterium]
MNTEEEPTVWQIAGGTQDRSYANVFLRCDVGKSGYIVSPLAVETVIQEGRGKQAEFKGEAGIELVDDLPWGETSLMGIGTSQV